LHQSPLQEPTQKSASAFELYIYGVADAQARWNTCRSPYKFRVPQAEKQQTSYGSLVMDMHVVIIMVQHVVIIMVKQMVVIMVQEVVDMHEAAAERIEAERGH